MTLDPRPTQPQLDAAIVLLDVVPPSMQPKLQDVIDRAAEHGVKRE